MRLCLLRLPRLCLYGSPRIINLHSVSRYELDSQIADMFSLSRRHGRPTIDHDDVSSLIQIVSWLLLCFSVFSVCAHFVTRWTIVKRYGLTDALLFISLVCCTTWKNLDIYSNPQILGIAQTITIILPPSHIFGESVDGLSMIEVSQALKVSSPFERE